MEKLLETLRCPVCRGSLASSADALTCVACGGSYPSVDGIPRLLLPGMRDALLGDEASDCGHASRNGAEVLVTSGIVFRRCTNNGSGSFSTTCSRTPPTSFRERRFSTPVAATGALRITPAKYGAEVWAIDLGTAVEVARRNTHSRNVNVVQADLHNPPFALESFDFIYSIGVLHHLPNPEAAFQNLLRFLKPGGVVQIYLYWKPEQRPIQSCDVVGSDGGAAVDDTAATQRGLCPRVSDGCDGVTCFLFGLTGS